MAKIRSIKKSASFGLYKDANGNDVPENKRDIVSVTFGSADVQNELAGAALNAVGYACSFHLWGLSSFDENSYKNAQGLVDFDRAFNDFVKKYLGTEDKEVSLYDFPVFDLCGHRAVQLQDGREMVVRRVAYYGTKDAAFIVAKNDMLRGMNSKYKPID